MAGIKRTVRRAWGPEQLWNGNTESLQGVLALFADATRSHFIRRRRWPTELAQHSVVRLATTAEVAAFLSAC
ncbi:MAG: hypothetical protein J2O48_11825 [Solirubrobacterales bacterium]|nr:hypothetical protein [Solirubrobacterales bacterium]